jgi:hypothetical protein
VVRLSRTSAASSARRDVTAPPHSFFPCGLFFDITRATGTLDSTPTYPRRRRGGIRRGDSAKQHAPLARELPSADTHELSLGNGMMASPRGSCRHTHPGIPSSKRRGVCCDALSGQYRTFNGTTYTHGINNLVASRQGSTPSLLRSLNRRMYSVEKKTALASSAGRAMGNMGCTQSWHVACARTDRIAMSA